MPRFERFVLRTANCEEREGFPNTIFYNPDAGKKVSKPRYYVFEKEQFAEALKGASENAEVIASCEVVKTYMSLGALKTAVGGGEPSGAENDFLSVTMVKILEIAPNS